MARPVVANQVLGTVAGSGWELVAYDRRGEEVGRTALRQPTNSEFEAQSRGRFGCQSQRVEDGLAIPPGGYVMAEITELGLDPPEGWIHG